MGTGNSEDDAQTSRRLSLVISLVSFLFHTSFLACDHEEVRQGTISSEQGHAFRWVTFWHSTAFGNNFDLLYLFLLLDFLVLKKFLFHLVHLQRKIKFRNERLEKEGAGILQRMWKEGVPC